MTLDPIAKPIAAILAFFYSLVPNYAVSIILLTVCVMIVLTPLTIKQTRSMLVMQKLQPELKRLQEQHKNDRQALNEAVMALYKEHNASPLGGCLPMLLPFPVFLALFRVLEGLSRTIHGKSVPKYLSPHTLMYKDIVKAGGHLNSFGMNLAKSAANVSGTFWTKLPYFILLLIMVGTQYYQQRQLTSRNPAAAQGQQAQIMKFIPVFFGVISIRFPAGVVVYWTVSNVIRIFQQWAMYQFDPKVKALVAKDLKEVEAKTREIDEHGSKPSKPPAAGPAHRRRGRRRRQGARPQDAAAQGWSLQAARQAATQWATSGCSQDSPAKAASNGKPAATGKPPRPRPSVAKAAPRRGQRHHQRQEPAPDREEAASAPSQQAGRRPGQQRRPGRRHRRQAGADALTERRYQRHQRHAAGPNRRIRLPPAQTRS